MATVNAKLRDATEQLRDVVLHRLRSEARIAEMEKRLTVVKENRRKHAEGRRAQLGGWHHSVVNQFLVDIRQTYFKARADYCKGQRNRPHIEPGPRLANKPAPKLSTRAPKQLRQNPNSTLTNITLTSKTLE